MKHTRFSCWLKYGALALGSLGFFCTSAHAAKQPASAADDPYGEWIGTLVQDKGENCPVNGTSLMQIEPKRMIFVPEMGTLILRGTPDKSKQHYHAQLVLKDAKNQPLPMVFEAHPAGDTFEGIYGTPECRAHVTLHRPENRSWKNFLGND